MSQSSIPPQSDLEVSTDDEGASDSDDDIPVPPQPTPSAGSDTLNTSRSEEKLSNFTHLRDADASSSAYGLFHSSFLSSLISSVCCTNCHSSELSLNVIRSKGLAALYTLYCPTCDKNVFKSWSSPSVRPSGRHDINLRTVLASKESGVHHARLSKLFSLMSLPEPMHHKTYQAISRDVNIAVVAASEQCMFRSAAIVRDKLEEQPSTSTADTDAPGITVSYDGTWHKRGHSSHVGVGVAIDFDSGLVLDAQVVSNFCNGCLRGPKPDADGYAEWLVNHRIDCQKNFDGSANAMEAEAAKYIFECAERKRGLRYTTMLCDGDSKAFTQANKSVPYEVVKEDCINHVAKRMYKGLDNVKKSNKAKLNRKLTKKNIEYISNMYAHNLKTAAPDVKKMKRSVLAMFFHMMSNNVEYNHRMCPEGIDSWCHFRAAEAGSTTARDHNPVFSKDVGPLIYPIFTRLSDSDLLERCAKMGTQNANESFNALILGQGA